MKPIGHKDDIKKMSQSEMRKKIERMRDRDAELVSGIFRNRENPANSYQMGSVTFMYKKWPGEEYKTYHLVDGERYKLPRGVVHHLNNNCFYREYVHLPGEKGETGIRTAYNDGSLRAEKMQASRKVHRYEFVPLDFMDDDLDMRPASDLVEVTVSP